MNTEKMRRVIERIDAATEVQERRAWLASLRPAHRAWHEAPRRGDMPCGECMADGMRQASATLAAALEGMRRASATAQVVRAAREDRSAWT